MVKLQNVSDTVITHTRQLLKADDLEVSDDGKKILKDIITSIVLLLC